MMNMLPNELALNLTEADRQTEELQDWRERAFVNFMIMHAYISYRDEVFTPPAAPIDFLYVFQVARAAYANRRYLDAILNGVQNDVEWGR